MKINQIKNHNPLNEQILKLNKFRSIVLTRRLQPNKKTYIQSFMYRISYLMTFSILSMSIIEPINLLKNCWKRMIYNNDFESIKTH
jgi:hypothetical protein